MLLAIPLLLASLVAPLLPAPTAYAVGNATDIDSDLQTTIRKYLNARWLVNCFTSNDLQKISSADVDSYNWFAGQDQDINRFESAAGSRPLVPQIIGAYYGAGKDATRGCSGENLKNAFTYLGFPDDGRSTYCSLGSQYEGSADNCVGGGAGEWDNLVPEHEVADAVLGQVREKNSSIFTDVESDPAGKYLTYYQSFMNVCIDSVETTPYKTGDEGGRNDYYKVPVVTKVDGKAKLEYYLGKGKDGGTPVALTALNSYDGHSASSYKSGEYGSFNASGAGTLIGLLKDGWRGIDIPDVEKDVDIQTKFKVPYGIRIQYFPKGTVVDCNEAVTKAREYADGYKVYAQNKADFTVASPVGEDNPGSSETTCAVDGIGWIVCPVVTFLSKLNDAAFGFLNNFLNVPPDVFSDPATKQAWEAFRNIANIAFVIAFLIIIYSQMTGAGVSNYGLKKLLPKLIIAAILVNVSYYICAIAVDISNILGASLYDLIKGINIGDDVGAGGAGSNLWANAGAVILGGTAIIGLLALIIFAPTSLLAFALVIMILIARQAFVVLLIVISPLAFVAYLLPNTEQWFKKWWKALVTILMVFPIIAVVFGASSLASDILIRVSEDGAGGGDDNQLMKIVGAAVLAVPLFAVPVLLKGALSAAGSIGAKVAGLQSGANKMAGKSIKNGRIGEAKTAWDRRRQGIKAGRRAGIGNGVRARANRAFDSTRLGRAIGGPRGAAHATSEFEKTYDEDVKAAGTLLQSRMGHIEILDAAAAGSHNGKELSEHEREAAIQYAMERANSNERRHILSGLDSTGDTKIGGGIGTMTRSQRKAAIGGMRAKGETEIYGNAALAALEATDDYSDTGTGYTQTQIDHTLAGGVAEAVNNGTLSVEAAAKDHRNAAYIASVATGDPDPRFGTADDLVAASLVARGAPVGHRTAVTGTARTNFHDAVADYKKDNPQAWTKLGGNTQGSLGSI